MEAASNDGCGVQPVAKRALKHQYMHLQVAWKRIQEAPQKIIPAPTSWLSYTIDSYHPATSAALNIADNAR